MAKKETAFHRELVNQMLRLATGSLGLAAALAWNELIKEAINNYIRPLIGGASGLVSLLIYAFIVTLLAVFITYNLSKFVKR